MRLNDGRVVPELCSQALRGKKLTLHGDGSQTRSFCYVEDLVEGIFRLSQSKEHFPVNIGNPNEYTMLQFAKVVQEIAGKALELEFLPAREDDPKRRQPDITRARTILQWEPKIQLPIGLKRTLDSFRSEI